MEKIRPRTAALISLAAGALALGSVVESSINHTKYSTWQFGVKCPSITEKALVESFSPGPKAHSAAFAIMCNSVSRREPPIDVEPLSGSGTLIEQGYLPTNIISVNYSWDSPGFLHNGTSPAFYFREVDKIPQIDLEGISNVRSIVVK